MIKGISRIKVFSEIDNNISPMIIDVEYIINNDVKFIEDNEPYINSIGVLTFNIESQTPDISELYSVEVPHIVKYSIDEPFNANGWLAGGEYINGYVSGDFTGIEGVYGWPQSVYLFGTSDIISGYCIAEIKSNYSDCSGFVEGMLYGNMSNNMVSGIMKGVYTNYKTNQEILMSGLIYGEREFNPIVLNENIYMLDYPAGKAYKLTELSGLLYSIDPTFTDNLHVIDIKNSNMLGRKTLANTNPLFGHNLHLTSKNLDAKQIYAKEQWKLIEYSVSDMQVEYNFTELTEEEARTRVENRNNSNITKTMIATPAYIQNQNNKIKVSSGISKNSHINSNLEYIYYAYLINDNEISITPYVKDIDIIDNNNILVGPCDDIEICHNLLETYALANNCKLDKINDYMFIINSNNEYVDYEIINTNYYDDGTI